eukprot:5548134-Pleurochrysis_carterae.AAC.1
MESGSLRDRHADGCRAHARARCTPSKLSQPRVDAHAILPRRTGRKTGTPTEQLSDAAAQSLV